MTREKGNCLEMLQAWYMLRDHGQLSVSDAKCHKIEALQSWHMEQHEFGGLIRQRSILESKAVLSNEKEGTSGNVIDVLCPAAS